MVLGLPVRAADFLPTPLGLDQPGHSPNFLQGKIVPSVDEMVGLRQGDLAEVGRPCARLRLVMTKDRWSKRRRQGF